MLPPPSFLRASALRFDLCFSKDSRLLVRRKSKHATAVVAPNRGYHSAVEATPTRVWAVAKGHTKGIFFSEKEARKSYSGYSGAVHAAFNTVLEAEEFIAQNEGKVKRRKPKKLRLEPKGDERVAKEPTQEERIWTTVPFSPTCD